jgi:hypothetical protein
MFYKKNIILGKRNRLDYLKAVSNSLIEATAIGAVQACYILLGLDIVISTRTVQNINSLPRHKLTNKFITDRLHLLTMDDEECAISNGIKSQLGQRDA